MEVVSQTVELRPFGGTDLGRSEINRGGTFFDPSGEITAISPCYLCMGAKTNDPLQKPLLVTRVKESRKVEQKDDEGEEGGEGGRG